MSSSQKPVFYDPTNQRAKKLRFISLVLGFTLTVLLIIFLISILFVPSFTPLPLASFIKESRQKPPQQLSISASKAKIIEELEIKRAEEQKKYALEQERLQNSKKPLSPLVIGFMVNWDDNSFESLKQNFEKIDILSPEWLHIKDGTGNITLDNEGLQKEVTEYVRSRNSNLAIIPLVNNFGWQKSILHEVLRKNSTRAHLISELLKYIKDRKYAGISIDFENIDDIDQRNFSQFIEEISSTFHAENLQVSVNVIPDNPAYEFKRLSLAADHVILMMYDENIATDPAGPISGIDWYSELLTNLSKEIPSNKMIIAMGAYSNDWQGNNKAEQKSFEDALLTATDSEGVISLNPISLSSTYQYYDDTDKLHTVWMQDSVSLFNQYMIASRFSPAGVALWRLGGEDKSIWNFIGNSFDTTYTPDSVQALLGDVTYSYTLDYESDGEILKVTGLPHTGKRIVTFNPVTGLISKENFNDYPKPYVITQYGKSDRKIALTFDDGPDDSYTSKILDILKNKNAPATFFLVGENIGSFPSLVRREYEEGHEIGNHTFSHPNISEISQTQLRLELSVTERMIESSTGHQSLLFRAPFAVDSEPTTPDQMIPVAEVSRLGYLMVGMHIDPSDWESPPSGQIISRVLSQIESGQGNVVLLHDGGGEREQTVLALPKLIDTLRAKGYNLVLVSDLLGKSRDEIMPAIQVSDKFEKVSNTASFSIARVIVYILHLLFLFGLILGIIRFFMVGILALIEYLKERRKTFTPGFFPSMAVIISAFNEEKVINQTISTLLSSTYPNFEIIVVDDGSTDKTLEKVKETFGENNRVQIYHQENSGKSTALNFGIAKTSADIVVSLDADTIFPPVALSKLARHFEDPNIGAVAGNAKVGNRNNLLTKFQALEYIISQNLDKRAFSVLDAITVVPGAVGAWRRKALLEAGGFKSDTLAEDSDLTISIRKIGYTITYEDEAIGITEAPETVKNLIKQRFRWMYGTLQVGWKHIGALLNPKYGSLGLIALPNIIIFQLIFPIVSPLMDLTVIVSIFATLFTYNQHPESFSAGSLQHILYFYLLFLIIEILGAGIAFLFERKEDPRLLVWLIIQRFYYRQLMYYIVLKSLFTSLRGIAVGWNKFDRTGTVKIDNLK
ncbi:glycosyltransferase [Patescibacteria group bacterium]|nr:glycosyltransferase [Patescibacteria group bacterium]